MIEFDKHALAGLVASVAGFGTSEGRTAPPAHGSPAVVRMEVVETEPGRRFHCLLLDTIPGVEYQVEHSTDLRNWTPLPESHYGLGQTVVVPMVEMIAAETPPPPSSPPTPAPRLIPASVMLRPAVGGRLVASFQAAGTRHAVQAHLPDLTAATEWAWMPLYIQSQSDGSGYRFCIMYCSNPLPVPEATAPLSEADAAMLAALEERFPDFDEEVRENVNLARSRQIVSVYEPGAKGFFRVVSRWDFDADDDGRPDWLEFWALADGDPLADVLAGDTNGNNIPDGMETDKDGDGVVDALDVSLDKDYLAWEKSARPLIVGFDTEGNGIPLQVNDEGRILFTGSVWKEGVSAVLQSADGGGLTQCVPLSIGDNGFILGIGNLDLPGDDGEASDPVCVTWPAAGGAPVPLRNGSGTDAGYVVPKFVQSGGTGTPIPIASTPPPSDNLVDSEGRFVALPAAVDDEDIPQGVLKRLKASEIPQENGAPLPAVRVFKGIPGQAVVADVREAGQDAFFILAGDNPQNEDDDIEVEVRPGGALRILGTDLADTHNRVTRLPVAAPPNGPQPEGVVASMAAYKTAAAFDYHIPVPGEPFLRHGNAWITAPELNDCLDFSRDARFGLLPGLMKFWHGGRWCATAEMAPGFGEDWQDRLTSRFTDTTRSGWTLAIRKVPVGGSFNIHTRLAVPLILGTATPGMGVDGDSCAASDDEKAHKPAVRVGNKDEFWLMIPAGGSVTAQVGSAACATTRINLTAPTGGYGVSPTILDSPAETLSFSAPPLPEGGTDAGLEKEFPLSIGTAQEKGRAIRAKIMKPRTVTLTVWPLRRPGKPLTLPPNLPTKERFDTYLNTIYQPQINLTFNTEIKPPAYFANNHDPGDPFVVVDAGVQLPPGSRPSNRPAKAATSGYSSCATTTVSRSLRTNFHSTRASRISTGTSPGCPPRISPWRNRRHGSTPPPMR